LSDMSDVWARIREEYERLRESALELGMDVEELDRIYSRMHGMERQ
jgi:hypothetical protein